MIETTELAYRDGATALKGLIAHDTARKGKRPGVVVFHEAPGLGPHVKRRIKMLAELGLVALAADLFGDGQMLEGEAMTARMAAFTKSAGPLRARLIAALDALRGVRDVDPARIAAIGYCMGGSCALELARSGADVSGVVSFHGVLATTAPAAAGAVKAKVLVCAGAIDPLVPPAQVRAFEDEMSAAGVDWQLVMYGGAAHSFTNADRVPGVTPGFEHHPDADRRSWRAMCGFFDELFGTSADIP